MNLLIKKYFASIFVIILIVAIVVSCSKSDDDKYVEPTFAVSVNLATVPYPKLSDYHFFQGEQKNLSPNQNVLPYEPASSLFADYAHKKRFVWMPAGSKATYVSDDKVLDLPVGAVLIKTFYYDNVQPNNTTQIIETRLLIKKSSGWKAYDYVWNAEQKDAILDEAGNGFTIPVTFKENNIIRSFNYKTPSQGKCLTCHKINPNQTGEITIPIGPKPQNLNTVYSYNGVSMNQIEKWQSVGYLDNSVPALSAIKSTIDYRDVTQSLQLRARSYLDINCAHCHQAGGHCEYVPQRFNFSNTDVLTSGVCLTPLTTVTGFPYIINGGNSTNSLMINKMTSVEDGIMMPYIGRILVHDEGVQLITDWINSLPACR